jgi:hypothetical protein
MIGAVAGFMDGPELAASTPIADRLSYPPKTR